MFFLVDPEEDPVVSTTFMSPQQVGGCPLTEVVQKTEPRLPIEIGQMIAKLLHRSRLTRLDEAKRHREEMIKEQKFFVKTRSLLDSQSLRALCLFLFL